MSRLIIHGFEEYSHRFVPLYVTDSTTLMSSLRDSGSM